MAPAPGEPKQNLSVALGMIETAAARGVDLLVLPELWSCGYDPETLGGDARRDAEPLVGPRTERLADAARGPRRVPGGGERPRARTDGLIHDTALVLSAQGDLVAWHRKAHLYPPTLEPSVFTPGDRLTTFDDPTLGTVGLVVGFDGDFPEVARALALRGARLVLAPCAYEVEGASAWDLLHPALALTNSQWWVQANQAGSHSTSTLLGSSRIIAPTGTVVAQASGGSARPGQPRRATGASDRPASGLQREGLGALLEDERTPALYGGLFQEAPAV